MKKFLALLLAMTMVMALVACGNQDNAPADNKPSDNQTQNDKQPEDNKTPDTTEPATAEEITLWTYPVGNWGDEANVKAITDAFTADTGIKVTVEYLDYTNGDDKVNTALTAGNQPDLVLEGPERLVANWGANGHMVDLADLIDAADEGEFIPAAYNACVNAEGKVYEYPMCMTAHCMAINKQAFEAADALQYVDLENRTWSTENFIKAVNALYAYYGDTVGVVYCNGQGGDQGTRELVTNMYGGTFTNADHSKLTWDDANNIKAFQTLYDLDGIAYDASVTASDEIAKFYQGTLKMAFCWNSGQQLNPNAANTGEGKTITGDDIIFLCQPTEDGSASRLGGGIWGFGIFDKGDASRVAAAKEFIKWVCDSEHTVECIPNGFFPVRSTAADGAADLSAFTDNEMVKEYFQVMLPRMGDYYQVIPGWAGIRTEWWTMLQDIGAGTPVEEAVAKGTAAGNAVVDAAR